MSKLNIKTIVLSVGTGGIVLRGSLIAVYNHAKWFQEKHGGCAIIACPVDATCDLMAYRYVSNRFRVVFYQSISELENMWPTSSMLYIIKYGTNDGKVAATIPTFIHCVFDMSQPHGDYYAGVSRELALKYDRPNDFMEHVYPYPPLTKLADLRAVFDIGKDRIVVGRYGGADTWNIDWSMTAISKCVRRLNNKITFLLINTPRWDNHPSIVYVDPIYDDTLKSRFLETCDAFLLAERHGHTFGYAVCEAIAHKVPILYFNGEVWNDTHLRHIHNTPKLRHQSFDTEETLLSVFDNLHTEFT
jgi:glycosyltransferase involved in cell wall biosynthesis